MPINSLLSDECYSIGGNMTGYYGLQNIATALQTMREYKEYGLFVFTAGSGESAIMFGWHTGEYAIRQFNTDAWHGPNQGEALKFFSDLVLGTKNRSPHITERIMELLWGGTHFYLSKNNGHVYKLLFDADRFEYRVSWGLNHFHNERWFTECDDACAFFDERVRA